MEHLHGTMVADDWLLVWLRAWNLIKAHHETFSWRKHILWLFDQTLISALLFLATVLNRSAEKVPLLVAISELLTGSILLIFTILSTVKVPLVNSA